MNTSFDNKDRSRYYGIRVGDYVRDKYCPNIEGIVTEYTLDNNRVLLQLVDGREYAAVAELLVILKKCDEQ